jgi:hypothetical protein
MAGAFYVVLLAFASVAVVTGWGPVQLLRRLRQPPGMVAAVLVVALAAVVAVLVGCGDLGTAGVGRVTVGEVVNRGYYPRSEDLRWKCVSRDEYYNCTLELPALEVTPESFWLEIEGYGSDGQRARGRHEVREEFFNRAHLGDWVDVIDEREVAR